MKKFLFFAAALLGLVACNNKGNEPINPGRQITLTATVDFGQGSNAPGRTVAPDASSLSTSTATFHWEKGDKVMLLNSSGTEMQLFTIDDNSIKGDSASFTGTALTDMKSYMVVYAGKNISEAFVTSLFAGDPIELTNATNGYNIVAACQDGNENGFTLSMFYNTLRLKLTGNVTLGSIKCYPNVTDKLETTLNFGTSGLALSSTAQEVWIPYAVRNNDIIFRFYDTKGDLIMEKTTVKLAIRAETNDLVTFPELEVKKPSPKDVFTAGSTFQITIFADEEHYNIFKYKYNSDQTFTCTYINQDGTDVTAVYASYCPCTKGTGNTFTFDFAEIGYLDYNADATPATAVMRPGKYESEFLNYTLTNFQVNGVDILDQITVTKQQAPE